MYNHKDMSLQSTSLDYMSKGSGKCCKFTFPLVSEYKGKNIFLVSLFTFLRSSAHCVLRLTCLSAICRRCIGKETVISAGAAVCPEIILSVASFSSLSQ